METSSGSTSSKPYVGKLGAGVITAIVTGIVSLLILMAFNTPQRLDNESEKRHNEQRSELSELRTQLSAMRDIVGTDERELQRIEGKIDKLEAVFNERTASIQKDIARLDASHQAVMKYLTEEQRLNRSK